MSTLDLVINIVDVADSADVANKEELAGFDLNKLLTGDSAGLTLAVKTVAEDGKSFVLSITDGTNALEKTVTMTGAEGTTEGEATPEGETTGEETTEETAPVEEEQTTTPVEEGTATLPQTGAVATGIGGVGAVTALAAFMKFRRR